MYKKNHFVLWFYGWLTAIFLLAGGILAEESAPATAQPADLAEIPFSELPATEFLRILRQPLVQDAWGEFTGRIIHQRKGQKKLEATLRVRITFTPESLYAQLVLNDRNVYGLEQHRAAADKTTQHLDLPEEEVKPVSVRSR